MAQHLAAMNIEARSVELPAKDAAEFIAGCGLVDELRRLITGSAASSPADASAARAVRAEALKASGPTVLAGALMQLETSNDGSMLFAGEGREYRVHGLSPVGLERLRVNVRLSMTEQATNGDEPAAMTRFHLDTIDLYQVRARSLFAQTAAKLCGASEQQLSADLLQLIEKLEAARLAMRKNGDEQNQHEAPMTPAEREAALHYLKDPKLTERILNCCCSLTKSSRAQRCADVNYSFLTQKERDNETGLDYFLARYYSNVQGRFTSVDPENAGAKPDDPQSWNGYAYARNNPLLYSDPETTVISILFRRLAVR
jgi:RHS repeat-associated protein